MKSCTSALACSRDSSEPAARRCLSQPKPYSSRAQASDGGAISNGDCGVDLGQTPGKAEMSVVELGGEARIRRPQLLRGEQELFGLGAGIADARHAREHEAAESARAAKPRRWSAAAALVGLRVSRHVALSPSCRRAR